MARTRFLRWAGLAAATGSVVALVRMARGGPSPAFDTRSVDPRSVDPQSVDPGSVDPPAIDPPEIEPPDSYVESTDGTCPADRPIKGNTRSGIFHVPEGAMYERTRADRCYATEEAATADGLRRAKR